ncbi:phage tail protein [Schumannella sp. 10F1B-5-1]|uniref:phage tail protein n=1 Tax=Schumannella sp. 10F1B-5-1 TaxID=2590780 RepID=UPI0011327393|nr:tail fiber protein [Schumannella sp. 10F1B-5-1]TPW76864.1 phage tail protein [Schumannella sp. 10F1B-5-1]
MNPFLGEIRFGAYAFAPKNWAFCNGQLLSIAQNQALFSLLGTQYGGNGIQNFALPDLRGRIPNHQGTSLTGSHYGVGQTAGTESVTLLASQLPAHTHAALASTANGTATSPQNALWAAPPKIAYASDGTAAVMHGASIDNTGGNQPHENRPPTLTLNAIISLTGIFPSRS